MQIFFFLSLNDTKVSDLITFSEMEKNINKCHVSIIVFKLFIIIFQIKLVLRFFIWHKRCWRNWLQRVNFGKRVSERAFPSSQTARHRFTARSVSCFRESRFLCRDWVLRRGGGPLVASLSASCACELHSEGMRALERESQTMSMTNGDAWPLRRNRPFETPRRGPAGAPSIHSLILARPSPFASSSLSFSLSFLSLLLCFLRWALTEIDLRSSLME